MATEWAMGAGAGCWATGLRIIPEGNSPSLLSRELKPDDQTTATVAALPISIPAESHPHGMTCPGGVGAVKFSGASAAVDLASTPGPCARSTAAVCITTSRSAPFCPSITGRARINLQPNTTLAR